MIRVFLSAGVMVLVAGLVGCQSMPMSSSRSVVGTWAGKGDQGDRPFTFGSVSFVGDRTFTAEASYNNQTRVQTGTWETKGNELHLTAGDTRRDYTYKVEGDMLTVTEPRSGNSITLNRVRPARK